MLLDFSTIVDGNDLTVTPSEAPRAASVMQTQLGSLEYAPTFGVDMAYFLGSELRIQTESYKSYCVQRLLQHQINVVNVLTQLETFFETSTYYIGSSEGDGSLIG